MYQLAPQHVNPPGYHPPHVSQTRVRVNQIFHHHGNQIQVPDSLPELLHQHVSRAIIIHNSPDPVLTEHPVIVVAVIPEQEVDTVEVAGLAEEVQEVAVVVAEADNK